jgi:hypothetical protein
MAWTWSRVGNPDAIQAEFERRFRVPVSRRLAVTWYRIGISVYAALLAFLAFYVAGRTG